jgi:hypothetical protein
MHENSSGVSKQEEECQQRVPKVALHVLASSVGICKECVSFSDCCFFLMLDIHILNSSVSQIVVRGPPAVRSDSTGGPQTVSKKMNVAEIASDTVRVKNTPVHVCVKIAFVG